MALIYKNLSKIKNTKKNIKEKKLCLIKKHNVQVLFDSMSEIIYIFIIIFSYFV